MHMITCVQGWKEGLSRDPPVAFVTGRIVFQAEAGDENPQVWSLDGGVSIVWKLVKNAESLATSQTTESGLERTLQGMLGKLKPCCRLELPGKFLNTNAHPVSLHQNLRPDDQRGLVWSKCSSYTENPAPQEIPQTQAL